MGSVLYDPAKCQSAGLSLAAWFEDDSQPSYMRTPRELHFRRTADGVFVVSGVALGDDVAGPQTFVAAFRSIDAHHP